MKIFFTLLFLTLIPLVASADGEVEVDGIYYYFNNSDETKTAAVRANPGKYTGDIVIPESVTYNEVSYIVTSIGYDAFYGCTGLSSVTIPNSVTSIDDYAFAKCSGLTSIVIPNSVTSLGRGIFSGCSSLTSLVIPNSVTSIETSVFSGCSSLISVVIPKGVTKIESSTFYGCTSLISVELPNGITSIGSSAFHGCNSLININIPSTISSIESEAFRECNSLESFIIPEGVTEIGKRTFWECNKLKSITIPKSITSIGEAAFLGCNSLKEVHISDIVSWCNMKFNYEYISLTNPIYYAQHLFLNDQEIKDLVIPDNVTSIVTYAFYGCKGLNSVTIPNSITSIDVFTFAGCSGLKSIILPENLTIIRGNAFQNCSSLENVTIPSKVEYIYQEAFAGCSKLKNVKSLAATPPFLYENAFSNYEIPLSVPKGARDTYLSTSPWNKFKEILSGSDTKYILTYKVDGEVYQTYELLEGATITPEPAPTKEGYDFSGWSTIPATMPAENVTITGTFSLITDVDEITIKDTGKTTWCSKYDLDFTNVEGVKAYTATGYNNITKTIWLTRVMEVPAGTGILVKGDAGTYKIPHATVQSAYANWFVGNLGDQIKIEETDGDKTNYYLSGKDGTFKSVAGYANIGKNKAYLQLPTSVFGGTRSIGISYDDEDGTTSIKDLTPALSEGEGAWYTLQGQRVAKPGKGLYIHNGKKVVIK